MATMVRSELKGAKEAIAGIKDLPRQVRYATWLAQKRTTEDFRNRLLAKVQSDFVLRLGRELILHRLVQAKVAPYGNIKSGGPLTSSVIIEGPEAKRMLGQLLLRHEDGGEHTRSGSTMGLIAGTNAPFYVPVALGHTTPKSLYPSGLGFVPLKDAKTSTTYYALGKGSKTKKLSPIHQTAGGGIQYKGAKGTFILDPAAHLGVSPRGWGIYQRTATGHVQLLWWFTQHVTIKPRLGFVQLARTFTDDQMRRNYLEAYAEALATARRA